MERWRGHEERCDLDLRAVVVGGTHETVLLVGDAVERAE